MCGVFLDILLILALCCSRELPTLLQPAVCTLLGEAAHVTLLASALTYIAKAVARLVHIAGLREAEGEGRA